MDNFRKSGPGGLRNRPEFVGGRPKSDADYGTKKKFGKKPGFHKDRGGDRGNRGGWADRGNKGGGFGGKRGGDRRDVEMFKTTCSACGKTAEVPFRPDGSKPVLCRECFAGKSDDRGGSPRYDRFAADRGERSSERNFDGQKKDREPSGDYQVLLKQVQTLEGKVNEILIILKSVPVPAEIADREGSAGAAGVAVSPAKEEKEVKPKKAVAKKVAKKTVKKAVKKVAKKTVKRPIKK